MQMEKDNTPSIKDVYRIAIIGSDEDLISVDQREQIYSICEKLGQSLAKNNIIVFSGGDNGIGHQVVKSVYRAGGTTISIFPGREGDYPLDYVTIPIYTEMGYGMRDILMLRSVEGVLAIGGGAGTLGELANAYNLRRPIVAIDGLDGWSTKITTPYLDNRKKVEISILSNWEDAVNTLKEKIDKRRKFFRKMHSFPKIKK